jgi:dihydroorotate dehydrogenase
MYKQFVKPLLFQLDPEKAHTLIMNGLRSVADSPAMQQLVRGMYGVKPSPLLTQELFGVRFPHPIGLAAGMDKNAEAVPMWEPLGFGFAEVGTVTPVGQPGNDKPRSFRLPADGALINRMGFNNHGAVKMDLTLRQGLAQRGGAVKIPIIVNIGKNKKTPNDAAHEDYRKCLQMLYPLGDFYVVNISSPNTPDLRALQHGEELPRLLETVSHELHEQAKRYGESVPKPFLVKVAPDMTDAQLAYTVQMIAAGGAAGIVATNTTIDRTGLTEKHKDETGGLSGKPLRARSTEVIRQIYALTEGKLPIIGSGGVFSAADAYEKIRAGAALVEILTSFIYEGPHVLRKINHGLVELLKRDGFTHITEAIGADHR